jgi:exportin-1
MPDLSAIADYETFKICCEFWRSVAGRLKREKDNPAFSATYGPVPGAVRRLHIERMQRPFEVLIVADGKGNIVRVRQWDRMALVLYHIMKETLVILTSVDPPDTLGHMDVLIRLVGECWRPGVYNHLCWSVGAIKGVLPLQKETSFGTRLLRIQLDLCDAMDDPQMRAIVAVGFMLIIGQYPRFLMRFPDFLVLIIKKLFESMHQDVPGVQNIAIQAFKTIAKTNCKKSLAARRTAIFLEMLGAVNDTVTDLSQQLIIQVHNALSAAILAIRNERALEAQLGTLMVQVNERWTELMGVFNCDDFAVLRDVSFVLRTNAAVANNSAHTFRVQLTTMFGDMMQIYRRCSDGVLPWIARYGANAPRFEQIRAMKCVTSAVLQVLINSTATIEHVPAILETIVQDYADSPRDVHVPEVLTLLRILMDRSPNHIEDSLAAVLGSVFSDTVSMINTDYETDVAFHMPLCKFLKGLVVNFLDALEATEPEVFELVVDAIKWGSSHSIHGVCTLSLEITRLLFEGMAQSLGRDEFLSIVEE